MQKSAPQQLRHTYHSTAIAASTVSVLVGSSFLIYLLFGLSKVLRSGRIWCATAAAASIHDTTLREPDDHQSNVNSGAEAWWCGACCTGQPLALQLHSCPDASNLGLCRTTSQKRLVGLRGTQLAVQVRSDSLHMFDGIESQVESERVTHGPPASCALPMLMKVPWHCSLWSITYSNVLRRNASSSSSFHT